MAERKAPFSIQTNLFAGVLTMIPLAVVWVVADFILTFLASFGAPVSRTLTDFAARWMPGFAPFLADTGVQWVLAILIALLLIYTIGAIASRVIGKRLLAGLEALIGRIPLVQTLYSSTKRLLGALQQQPEQASRVVLIAFPHPGAKAIGLVMRIFLGPQGEQMAAVFVPTTPNPTSGYLELVPVESLVPTDMTMEQAMTMIVSGGAVAPDHLFARPGRPIA